MYYYGNYLSTKWLSKRCMRSANRLARSEMLTTSETRLTTSEPSVIYILNNKHTMTSQYANLIFDFFPDVTMGRLSNRSLRLGTRSVGLGKRLVRSRTVTSSKARLTTSSRMISKIVIEWFFVLN